MMNRFIHLIIALAALLLLTACDHDEPVDPIKPLSERTLLVIGQEGNICDINGVLIKQLPDCRTVTQIIVEGEDYFVSGVNSKDKVGYWKNGKWNTLHVDFIDDVDHWTFGIAKWDYNIYLLDYPNVLRNSGIFPLRESENFTPSNHGISVSEGKCYVVGTESKPVGEFMFVNSPVIYTERKGFRYLAEACEHISMHHPTLPDNLGVIVLGGDAESVKDTLYLPVYTVNYLSNETEIAQLYSAADLFVTPSLQDNLPNTIVEAMACGTPCVGFDVGGIPEMISHKQDGYIADYCDSIDFAHGIAWCLDEARHPSLCKAARDNALATYSEPAIAHRYLEVYQG